MPQKVVNAYSSIAEMSQMTSLLQNSPNESFKVAAILSAWVTTKQGVDSFLGHPPMAYNSLLRRGVTDLVYPGIFYKQRHH